MSKPSIFLVLIAVLAISGCARPFGSGNDFELKPLAPDAASVVAAERAMHRMSEKSGRWKAYAATVADDGVFFVPNPVDPKKWLGEMIALGAQAEQLQNDTGRVFLSCDGRTAASTGVWSGEYDNNGFYSNIWQRRYDTDAGSADWKWLIHHGDTLTKPRAQPDRLESRIATCTTMPSGRLGGKAAPLDKAAYNGEGASRDQSLMWAWSVQENGERRVRVYLWNGSSYDTVIDDIAIAGGAEQ